MEKRPDAGRRDAVRLHTAGARSIGRTEAEGHARAALWIYDPLIPFVYVYVSIRGANVGNGAPSPASVVINGWVRCNLKNPRRMGLVLDLVRM